MCLAIPGKIEDINAPLDDIFRQGIIAFGQVRKEVNLSMVPKATIGDYVLVHVGVAISIVDEEEAQRTFDLLQQLGETDDLEP